MARAPGSSLALPWFFRSRAQVGGVQREHAVWVLREGAWEALAQERSSGPNTRTPWRILPGRQVRVIVAEGEAVEALVLRSDAGEVETRLLQFLFEWTRPDGESVRLFEGRTTFPSGPIAGIVLDISRRWEAPAAGAGDWIFLTSGSALQVFLEEAPPSQAVRAVAGYRGWSRSGPETQEWADLTVAWDDMRPFERARRDVPYRWVVSSADGSIRGELVAVSNHLATGESDGPILPVSAVFWVTGSIRIGEREVAVEGVVRHAQR